MDAHPRSLRRLWLGFAWWLLLAHPDLAALLTEAVGDGWVTNLGTLRRIAPLADDSGFRQPGGPCRTLCDVDDALTVEPVLRRPLERDDARVAPAERGEVHGLAVE